MTWHFLTHGLKDIESLLMRFSDYIMKNYNRAISTTSLETHITSIKDYYKKLMNDLPFATQCYIEGEENLLNYNPSCRCVVIVRGRESNMLVSYDPFSHTKEVVVSSMEKTRVMINSALINSRARLKGVNLTSNLMSKQFIFFLRGMSDIKPKEYESFFFSKSKKNYNDSYANQLSDDIIEENNSKDSIKIEENTPKDSIKIEENTPKDSIKIEENTPKDSIKIEENNSKDSIKIEENTPKDIVKVSYGDDAESREKNRTNKQTTYTSSKIKDRKPYIKKADNYKYKLSYKPHEKEEQRPSYPRRDGGDRRPAYPRRDGGGDRRPSYPRRDGGGDRRPSYPRRDGGGDRRPSYPRRDGGDRRPSYPRRDGGDKRPSYPRRDGGGDKRPAYPRRDGGDRRPSYPRRDGGDKRPAYPRRDGGDRRPSYPRRDGGGDRRPSYPRRDGGSKRPSYPRRDGGDRKE